MPLAQIPGKLGKVLVTLAVPALLLLAIANILAVAGPVGVALFVDAESAAGDLFALPIIR